jgi:hypothetical protein
LQPILLGVGVAMGAICAVPSIRRYCAIPSGHGGDRR